MQLLLFCEKSNSAAKGSSSSAVSAASTASKLTSFGYNVLESDWAPVSESAYPHVHQIILCMPLEQAKQWTMKYTLWVNKPLIWWFEGAEEMLPKTSELSELPMDGMLAPDMGVSEIRRVLYMSLHYFDARSRWAMEKGQLLARLEERKWIDAAKGILCKMKNISEPEAYDFLRKEAMNQRKRVVEVASSIVSVYKLLEEGKTSGKRR